MRLLLTRPREDSERLAEKLEAAGHEVLIEPVFDIRPALDAPLDLDGVQALLFTSANGVRAFALRSPRRDLRVLAVGDATAAAAREFGFAQVESAGGNVEDLARLARERLAPAAGALLHVCGSAVAGDLAGELAADGFTVRRAVLYEAVPIAALSDATATALREGQVDAVLFFSPRTAAVFTDLVKAAGLEPACSRVAAIGLSAAVDAAAAGLPWKVRESATEPTEAALLAAVERRAGERAAASTEQAIPKMNDGTPSPQLSPPPQPRAGMALALLALVLAAAALGAVIWRELNPPQDQGAALAARLDQRLGEVERTLAGRVGALEREIPGMVAKGLDQARAAAERAGAPAMERIAGVEARLEKLTASLDALAGRVDALAQEPQTDPARLAAITAETRRLAQEVAQVQDALAALNAGLGERSENRRTENVMLATGQLRQALARGGPYANELSTLRNLADDPELAAALQPLAAHADRGIPTRQTLRARFDAVGREIVRRARVARADGWLQPLFDRLSSLVSVRRVGEVPGDSPVAIVARAERRLLEDDLAGAAAELGKLEGPFAEPAQDWLADARARLHADAAVERLTALALRGPAP